MKAVVAGLPRSCADRAEHHGDLLRPRQIVDARSRLIDDLQRVHPHVALRMPLRLLRAADEREQLGEQPFDRRRGRARAPGRSTAAARRAAFRSRPRRVRRGRSSSGIAAAEIARGGVDRRARTARRTARRAARAGCRRRTSTDRPRAAAAARGRRGRRNGSRYSSVSGSQEIALMVKSRRRAASSIAIDGSPVTANRDGRVPTSNRAAAARRRCRRPCRPGSSRRPLRRGRTTRAARAADRRRRRTLRGRRSSTHDRAADRAPSRRRSARGRRPRGRASAIATQSSVIRASHGARRPFSTDSSSDRLPSPPLHDPIADAGRDRVEHRQSRATFVYG